MKKSVIAAVFAIVVPSIAQAQVTVPQVSPRASISQTIGLTDVTISYSRPGVKDREIWGGLVPLDEIWRTGANAATTIELSHDARVGGEAVPAGKYALFTIPGEKEWTVILNSDWDQSGASRYDEKKNVASFRVKPRTGPMQEWMAFHVPDVSGDAATFELAWEKIRIPIRVEVDTRKITLDAVRAELARMGRWVEPYRGANWAFSQGVVDEETLGWIDQSIGLSETWWNLSLKARMLAAAGRHAEALVVAERALAMAGAMENPPDTSELQSEMKSWK